MIADGARVKVIDPDLTYSTYLSFLAKYQSDIGNENLKKFHFGTQPAKDDEFTIILNAFHPETSKEIVSVIVNDTNLFMVEQGGLVKIEPIKVGDRVVITDTGGVYTTYEEFVLRHKNQLKSEDFWHFKYGLSLPSCIENVTVFEVLCIDYHGKKWAGDKLVAIIKDNIKDHVFVIDVKSLKRID